MKVDMRQENENQHEFQDSPPSVPVVEQAAAMSELAALSAKVIEHGLVREHRPVFVYDAKQAKEKTGNAARQARLREKRAAQGLVMAQIPAEIAAQLKAVGGDWSLLLGASSPPPNPGLVSPPTGDLTCVKPAPSVEVREITKEVRVEVPVEVIKEVRVEVPGPVRIVEKIIEKPVQKLTADQKKSLDLGVKVRSLKGWRARFVSWIL
uniref:hypothetical protein n=1 Tax=Polaromonas sp. W11N TaxID=1840303 RepID=UPI002729569F|nr:hypothetical protein [Polaromonas sp. W11N]